MEESTCLRMIPLRGEEAEVFILQLSLVLGEGCFGDALIFQHSWPAHVGRAIFQALEKALKSRDADNWWWSYPKHKEMVGIRDMRGGVTEFATNPASKDEEPLP